MAEAVKLEEAEDYVVKSYLQFVEGCKFFQTSEDTPFVAALKAYLETGKISEPLECCKPSKENAEEKSTRRRGRQKENTTALKEISENDMQIKSEKISEVYSESSTASSTVSETVTVKSEKEEMPAPAKLPPWKKKIKTEAEEPKRSTRTRGRKNKEETAKKESNVRDSDVQIQNSTVTTIEISDESDADKKSDVVSDTDSERSTRSTRTKTRKNKEAEKVENDTEELPKRVTRTKARKKNAEEEEESKKADVLPKRSTRTKTKAKQTAKLDENIIEDGTEEEVETRSTRTKTRAKNAKRIRSESTDIESTKQTENKRSRSDSGSEQQIEENTTAKTVFEDARTSVDELPLPTPADATFVKTPEHQPPPISDATVVVDKPKVLNVANGRPETTVKDDDLFTDDESEDEGAQKKGKGKIIQVFSPYDKTPVKNKVKAFEKLAQTSSSSSSNIPRCVPRQKPSPDATRPPKSATPLQSAFLPKVCSTSKIQKTLPKTDASFTQQQRSHSALKVSSAEYRERERQRAEKEREAQRKKDAMLAAIVEEKRRRREEKVARAQQQREAREAEKRRLVEAQQAREEKHRRAMQEREERAARQREEQERRRAVAKAKAAEAQREKEMMEKLEADRERLQELEARKLEKLKALQQQRLLQQQQLPVYMTTRPPPLPTFDCYDSDDPEYDNAQRRRGDTWDNDKHMKMVQCTMMSAGDKIKNTLFCVQAQSVNLTEIFENIDPRKLKRTSSAIWRRPPRFTMIPNLEETRFSEDEEEYEDATQ